MSFWTPERVQQLRDKWDEGVSGGVIAGQLGTTRSAVCAKARGLGLASRVLAPVVRKSYDNSRRAAVAQVKALATPSKPRKPVSTILPDPKPPKPLLELDPGECRWPLGNGPFVFCALPTDGAFPYCACHARMAYQKVAA